MKVQKTWIIYDMYQLQTIHKKQTEKLNACITTLQYSLGHLIFVFQQWMQTDVSCSSSGFHGFP